MMFELMLVWAIVGTASTLYYAFGCIVAERRVAANNAAVEYYLARIQELHKAMKQREQEYSEFRHKG